MFELVKLTLLLASVTSTSFHIDENWLYRLAPSRTVVSGIAFGPRAVAPFGAIVFCHNFPESCQPLGARGVPTTEGRVIVSSGLLKRLADVNRAVNAQIRPKIDLAWHVGGASGDCKDYALTKRDILNKIGLPTSATLIATALAPSGRMHAVLVVRTDQGDFVLDNLSSTLRNWATVPYVWDEIQSPDDPSVWVKIAGPSVS